MVALLSLVAAACATPEPRVATVPAAEPGALETPLVRGADTSYLRSLPSLQFIATSRSGVRGGAPAVAGVERRFEALFGDAPPDISIVVIDSATPAALRLVSRPPTELPTVMFLAAATGRRADRRTVARQMSDGIALAAAHGWVRAYADAWTRVLGVEDAVAGATIGSDLLDPRIPDWLDVALLRALVDSGAAPSASAALRAHPASIESLSALFATPVGEPDERLHALLLSADDSVAGDAGAAYVAEAVSVLAYLRAREGEAIAGRLTPALIAGHSADTVLAALPDATTPAALEADWRAWLDAGSAIVPPAGRPEPAAEPRRAGQRVARAAR